MYRLKWPVDFSSIAKWTRDKIDRHTQLKSCSEDKKAA